MTKDEFDQLSMRDKMFFEFFTIFKRDLKRIADAIERLVEADSQR